MKKTRRKFWIKTVVKEVNSGGRKVSRKESRKHHGGGNMSDKITLIE